MKVYLLRHGQSVANAEGWVAGQKPTELTEQGKNQTHEFGQKHQAQFQNLTLMSSTMRRAMQTAAILAPYLGLEEEDVLTSELCIERALGKFHGRPKAEYYQAVASGETEGEIEPLASLRDRALAFGRGLLGYQLPVLVVSHQGFIKMFRQLATEPENWQQAMDTPRVDNLELVKVDLSEFKSLG